LQHTVPIVVAQSVSVSHWSRPACAFWQLLCADGSKLVATQAWPFAESQSVSLMQNCGQAIAEAQTLPATPP
jgi:hypothetical protein